MCAKLSGKENMQNIWRCQFVPPDVCLLLVFTWAQWFLKTIMQVSGSTPFRTRDCPSRFPLATIEAIMVNRTCGLNHVTWMRRSWLLTGCNHNHGKRSHRKEPGEWKKKTQWWHHHQTIVLVQNGLPLSLCMAGQQLWQACRKENNNKYSEMTQYRERNVLLSFKSVCCSLVFTPRRQIVLCNTSHVHGRFLPALWHHTHYTKYFSLRKINCKLRGKCQVYTLCLPNI